VNDLSAATEFEAWFSNVVECSAAWEARDFDRLHALDRERPASPAPDMVAARVSRLCDSALEWTNNLGPSRSGHLLWYLMGVGEQVWHDVAKASAAAATQAILSLKSLYGMFASRLTEPVHATQDASDPLGSVCYMLWDIDGGLESIPRFDRPPHLVAPCFEVLEHALSLDSPACWQSALHGLGHIQFSRKDDRARELIDAFLRSRGNSVPEHLAVYAAHARKGYVQ
jgi:hypothetical protein